MSDATGSQLAQERVPVKVSRGNTLSKLSKVSKLQYTVSYIACSLHGKNSVSEILRGSFKISRLLFFCHYHQVNLPHRSNFHSMCDKLILPLMILSISMKEFFFCKFQ